MKINGEIIVVIAMGLYTLQLALMGFIWAKLDKKRDVNHCIDKHDALHDKIEHLENNMERRGAPRE